MFETERLPEVSQFVAAAMIIYAYWKIQNSAATLEIITLIIDVICKTVEKFGRQSQVVRLSIRVTFQARASSNLGFHKRGTLWPSGCDVGHGPREVELHAPLLSGGQQQCPMERHSKAIPEIARRRAQPVFYAVQEEDEQ
ncbi:hypothetical protein KIN20_027139 [Parelaphostrongylus tenuis]|uniref:Uncharacterized protein n=1 Tax=Parelaphostrongylus tenuis TaxID=148309 RepID=A0AAD5QYX8_PARTN|nr:hypothetical protein KIN20_027139 [Parelaphostrongylus tenuis]